MHLVDIYYGVECVEAGGDMSAVFLHFQLECVHNIVYCRVGVDFGELECSFLPVEHRHLQHFLYLEAQPLGLVVDHRRYLLEHCRRFAHALVVEHLGRQ